MVADLSSDQISPYDILRYVYGKLADTGTSNYTTKRLVLIPLHSMKEQKNKSRDLLLGITWYRKKSRREVQQVDSGLTFLDKPWAGTDILFQFSWLGLGGL